MDFETARRSMVENQLRTNQIVDPAVLAAMGRLPREAFVPETLAGIAYVDEDLPLGGGRYLVEPLVLARMLQAAEIGPDDSVLVVGGGAGYEAAVAAEIAGSVVMLECEPALADRAADNLTGAGVGGVEMVRGPLPEGAPDRGPFDVVVFCGAIADVPPAILDQLAEGGRLLAIIRAAEEHVGKGVIVRRIHGVVSRQQMFDAAVPWLPGFEPEPGFVF